MHGGPGSDARSEAAGARLVLLGADPLDAPEALLENGRIKARFATPLRRFSSTRIFGNVGNHVPVENRLAVGPAVVDAVQAGRRGPSGSVWAAHHAAAA